MLLTRTPTGYKGVINGARFTVTIENGQIIIEGKPGHFLNTGESRQIEKAVKQTEAQPLFGPDPKPKKFVLP